MSLKSLAAEFLAIPIKEAGARHSKADVAMLQTIHDHATKLGAACSMAEAGKVLEAITAVSNGDIATMLSAAIRDHYAGDSDYGPYTYVVGVFGDDRSGEVVYYAKSEIRRAPYSVFKSDLKATCTVDCENSIEVNAVTQYLAAEAQKLDITGDVIPLREGAVGQDGTAHLKLIQPGWGSSGYYSAAVLERDGPAVFKAGTKNFWNHQTSAEEASRPEGDLRDLASVLTEDARYDKEGAAGPGLYAKAKVFEEFRQPVDDLAKHIGMSIRATGTAKEGQAEGRRGPIIEKLTSGISVDYVTTPGAGGKILQLFEAVRSRNSVIRENRTTENPQQEASMDAAEKERFDKLQESAKLNAETNAKLAESNRKLAQRLARSEARDIVKAKLETVRLPEKIKANLIERICPLAPITTEGELDTAALNTLTEARIKEAGEDLAALGGQFVAGMGTADEPKLSEAQQKEAETNREKENERTAGRYGFGGTRKVGAKIFNEGREAFDPEYNSADKEGAA